MTEKGKRAKITPESRALILDRSTAYPRIQRTALADKLQAEFEKKGLAVPQLDVIERMISWYRNHATDNPQDKPWSLGTLDDNPISADALRVVLQSWVRAQESGYPLSIRRAKWIARLYACFGDERHRDLWALEDTASKLATLEIILSGGSMDWRPLQIELYEKVSGQKVYPEQREKLLSKPKGYPDEDTNRWAMQRLKRKKSPKTEESLVKEEGRP